MQNKNKIHFLLFLVLATLSLFANTPARAARTLTTDRCADVRCHDGAEVFDTADYERGTIRTVTAYTSEVSQTDLSPFVGASGQDFRTVKGNICAANFVPLGTTLTIDKLGTCTVLDRMNSRYPNRVDWYMRTDTARAIRFGVQKLNVTFNE